MAALSIGAAAIHFAVTAEHFTEFWLFGGVKLLWPFLAPIITRRLHASLARGKALIEAKPR